MSKTGLERYVKAEQKKGNHSEYLNLARKQVEQETELAQRAESITHLNSEAVVQRDKALRIDESIASATEIVSNGGAQNNSLNQIQSNKIAFNGLFNRRDFEAAEEFARRNVPTQTDISNASQREKAAWVLASMGMAQYMQGGADKLEQAERALQTALSNE